MLMRWHPGVMLMATLGGFESEPARLPDPAAEVAFAHARERMVRDQIAARGVTDARVLEAMTRVPRHAFVPAAQRAFAYEDGPLPIGHGQTISQPYIVAFMTGALAPRPEDKVLEIGTGSGYQAAVLSGLVAEIYSIELIEPLARKAVTILKKLGCRNVKVRCGDGYHGWPEAAPFDAIVVTCAPEQVPEALVDQLKIGGRLIVPVGTRNGPQELVLFRKTAAGLERKSVMQVRFVPMLPGH